MQVKGKGKADFYSA